MPVDQLQRQLGERLFFVLHLTWLGVIILVRKKTGWLWTKLLTLQIKFFQCHWIALQTIKSQTFLELWFLKLHHSTAIGVLSVEGGNPLKTLVGWGIKCFLPLARFHGHELLIFIKMCATVRKFFKIPMRINWFCCSIFLFLVNLFDFNVPLQSDFWSQRILSQACKSKLFITCLLSWLKDLDFHFLYI